MDVLYRFMYILFDYIAVTDLWHVLDCVCVQIFYNYLFKCYTYASKVYTYLLEIFLSGLNSFTIYLFLSGSITWVTCVVGCGAFSGSGLT